MAKTKVSASEWLYTGKMNKQMEQIHNDGLVAAPAAYILSRRLEHVLDGMKVPEHLYFYTDTGDGIAEHPDRRFKYVFDCFADGTWKNKGRFKDEEFVLHDGAYEQLQGVEFSRDEHAGVLNRDFSSLEKATSFRVWRVAGRDAEQTQALVLPWDSRLVREYGLRVVFPRFEQAMGVYLSETSQRPWLRAAYVDRLEGRSQLYGRCDLDYDCGRLVGIAPEALEAARLRSFEICERSTQMVYPALAGEREVNAEERALEGTGDYGIAGKKKKAPVEEKSRSGFQPGREYNIEIVEGSPDEKYVPATHLASVLYDIEQGGKLAPEMRELILRRTKEGK